MYLLILFTQEFLSSAEQFTFHNVSINSEEEAVLLEQVKKFTFHNVSINSLQNLSPLSTLSNLHSIMYLLILVLSHHGRM